MIPVNEILSIALRSLRVNKMRSALTMLGIVIGVAAVICMFAVGNGANEKISASIASMGSNLLMVRPGAATSGGKRGGGSKPSLTLEDAEAVAREIPTVEDVAPVLRGTSQIVYGNTNWSTSIWGTTNSIMNVRDWTLALGRGLTDSDVRGSAKVCLLGQTVVDELFGNQDPVGSIVRIDKIPMKVIGVLQGKGSSGMGNDQDDVIFVPITTVQKRLFGSRFPGKIGDIMIKGKTSDVLEIAERDITFLLAQRHRIRDGEENDFNVRNLSEIMEAAKESTKVMSMLLAAIASVSLLVGGIGIMNIMLVSVTERTREIGIRMAIGAQTNDILAQFLTESIIMSLSGGAIGILLGALGASLVSHLTGWTTSVSSLSVVLAVGFSAFIGISFGFYPAWKASQMSPIEALRYE